MQELSFAATQYQTRNGPYMTTNKINRIQEAVGEIISLEKESADFDLFLAEAQERSTDGTTVGVTVDKTQVFFDLTTITNVVDREKTRIQNRIDNLEAKLSING